MSNASHNFQVKKYWDNATDFAFVFSNTSKATVGFDSGFCNCKVPSFISAFFRIVNVSDASLNHSSVPASYIRLVHCSLPPSRAGPVTEVGTRPGHCGVASCRQWSV